MKQTANAQFSIASWDEKPYSEGPGLPKLTKASVSKKFTGDLDGEGQVEYLMMYRSDGTAQFVGIERFTGTLGGKAGSFVLQRTGVFEDGKATESYAIVSGSGTGDLAGVSGSGTSSVGHGNKLPFALRYELA